MFLKSKAERQANYLLKMILRQNKSYRKKENRIAYFYLFLTILSMSLIQVFFLSIENPFPIIILATFLISLVLIRNRHCVIEHSGLISNSMEIDSLNIFFEMLPKYESITKDIEASQIERLISDQKYYIVKYYKFKTDPHLKQLGERFLFELKNLQELDGEARREKELKREELLLSQLKDLQRETEYRIAKKQKALMEFRMIKKTREMNEIEETAPSMMVVD